MHVRYYMIIDDNPDERHVFNDIESMQVFLITRPDEKGELFVDAFSGVKITYDTHTGVVRLENREQAEWITFQFSENAFHSHLHPVEQAVQYIAKQYFLTELYLLRDPALCSLIDQYIEMDNQTGKVLSHPRTINIENVLMEIADFVQPYQGRILSFANLFTPANHQIQPRTSLHHAINQAFIKCGIDSNGLAEIKSKHDVIQIMKMINDFYRQNMDSEAGKTSAMHKRS